MKLQRFNKYGNTKVTIDTITFDSKREAKRYGELKLLEEAGEITGLEVHMRYLLQPAFVDRQGKKHKAIFYEADFSYSEWDKDEPLIVEDVKGMRTALYLLKKKLFLYKYPMIHFREL